LSEGHEGAPATTLLNGKVLVAGGRNDPDSLIGTNIVELYDPDSGTWARGDSLPSPRVSHTATLLPVGTVMVVGGFGSLRTAILYDPATGSWSSPIWRPGGVILGSSTALSDGSVLVAGGMTDVYTGSAGIFDPVGRQWNAAASMSVARAAHTATLLQDGKVLVAGGRSQASGPLSSAELYGTFPPGTITPALTGSWYDPAQSGHGLHIEVLPDYRFLAAWFTFDTTGTQQAWFMGVGTYSGNTATVASVVQPVGGRWIPNFDAAEVVNRPWGTLTFTFTDCNHGRVDFDSTAPGYGRGSMNLTRLTQPAGLACP
jgi:hypothetical protein